MVVSAGAGCPVPRALGAREPGAGRKGPQKVHVRGLISLIGLIELIGPIGLIDIIGLIDQIDLIGLVDLIALIDIIDLTDLREQLQRELMKEHKYSDWGYYPVYFLII